jgi:CRP-like cAMP-binding protein
LKEALMTGWFDLLQWMPAEAQATFGMLAQRRRYRAGETIYGQGTHGREMYRLVDGSVRLSFVRANGCELVYLVFAPGDCFGVSSVVDGGERPQTAQASTDITVDVLQARDFDGLRAAHREADEAMMKLLARQMRAMSASFANASLGTLRQRVARCLADAARSFGKPAEGGIALDQHLPQSEIALMVGTSRQSVNRVLQEFQSEGLVATRYGSVLIRSPGRIGEIAHEA